MAYGCGIPITLLPAFFTSEVSHDILGQREDECLETLGQAAGT